VHRLRRAVELPLLPEYGGCKSWIELAADVDTADSVPALDQPAFDSKLERFRQSLV
jgi:hypothetical protein